MAEVYVTLSEAAELEGVQYQTMARRTQRNKKELCDQDREVRDRRKGCCTCGGLLTVQAGKERMEGTGEAEIFHGRISGQERG